MYKQKRGGVGDKFSMQTHTKNHVHQLITNANAKQI